jgi:hypothetical protein
MLRVQVNVRLPKPLYKKVRARLHRTYGPSVARLVAGLLYQWLMTKEV